VPGSANVVSRASTTQVTSATHKTVSVQRPSAFQRWHMMRRFSSFQGLHPSALCAEPGSKVAQTQFSRFSDVRLHQRRPVLVAVNKRPLKVSNTAKGHNWSTRELKPRSDLARRRFLVTCGSVAPTDAVGRSMPSRELSRQAWSQPHSGTQQERQLIML